MVQLCVCARLGGNTYFSLMATGTVRNATNSASFTSQDKNREKNKKEREQP